VARLISDLILEARAYIQDTDGSDRYSDADLVTYANDAMAEVMRIRPDYYYTLATAAGGYDGYEVPQYTTSNMTSEEFPLSQQAYTATAYFIAGSAALRDDEHTVDARATALLGLFEQKLKGR
jgi:hypothetical protein